MVEKTNDLVNKLKLKHMQKVFISIYFSPFETLPIKDDKMASLYILFPFYFSSFDTTSTQEGHLSKPYGHGGDLSTVPICYTISGIENLKSPS